MVSRYLKAMPHRPPRADAARKLIETYDLAVEKIGADPPAAISRSRLLRFPLDQNPPLLVCIPASAGAIITNIFDGDLSVGWGSQHPIGDIRQLPRSRSNFRSLFAGAFIP
jgi:hypothetical protein